MSKPRPSQKASAKPPPKPKKPGPRAKKGKFAAFLAGNTRGKRIALIGGIAVLALTALTGVGTAIALWYAGRGLPSADALRRYEPPQTTRVLDQNGTVVAEMFSERRTVVPMSRIPRVLVLSVLAAEDADFYHHTGMDLPSMLRVAWKAVAAGRATQGGSTITQQVVKNLLLSPERTLERKLKELILSRRLESELSKDEILGLYLNHINFGHGRYGVQEAARFYFDKDVDKLNLSEASLIAGIPQSPSRLSPRTHPEAARRRQMFVLAQLETKRPLYWDDLPLEEIERARRTEAKLSEAPYVGERAPEFAQIARQVLIDAVGEERATKGGFTITTTLDLPLEDAARKAVREGVEAIDVRQGKRAPLENPRIPDKALTQLLKTSRVDHPSRKQLQVGRTYDAVLLGDDVAKSTQVRLSIDGTLALAELASMKRYNPAGLDGAGFGRAGVKVRATVLALPEGAPVVSKLALGPEAAALLVDTRTREVRAMVGGYEVVSGFNRATQALRQPGSSFKPIVYALGLRTRRFTPASIVIDAPGAYDNYKPGNYETWNYEGSVRLRYGLAHSINSVAVRVIDELGPASVVDFARSLGITSPLEPTLGLSLGASEVRLSELVNAYATFAVGGRYAPLMFVKRITDAKGQDVKLKSHDEPRDVLTPAEAYVTTSLLSSVVEEGTASKAKVLGRPAAGKTGTSNQARDAWFCGYTPALVAGVWVGYDDHRPLGAKESGTKSALPIWIELMRAAHGKSAPEPFAMPSGVTTARIDPANGLLAYEGEADAIDEVFLEGTAPVQVALPPDVADTTTFMMEQLAPQ
ncbi:MAG: Multimodular transpeptidase-transglycosylase [Myxococcaceae bacterium]|nr:Multimodular transpeptidase-transglycosylase [Myxococcaceae bacterium]